MGAGWHLALNDRRRLAVVRVWGSRLSSGSSTKHDGNEKHKLCLGEHRR